MSKNILLHIVLAITFLTCANLEEDTSDVLTLENTFTNQEEVESGVAGVYRPYINFYLNAQAGVPTLSGDDLTTISGGNKGDYREFDQFKPTEGNIWLREFNWELLFETVYRANTIINNYTKAPETEARERAVAQAFFLRGWAYFNLVRTFGPVPLILDLPTGDEPRMDEQKIYDQIISDIRIAIENLPERWDGQPGRVSIWAAKLYLSKVYLTMAGWPLKQTDRYKQAAALANDVMVNSGYELMDDYGELWLASNDNNIESILAIQACTACDGDWGLSNRTALSVGPSDTDPNNGWDDYFSEIAFFNEFPDGPRKEATFRTEILIGDDLIPWEETTNKHPYYLKITGQALGPVFEVTNLNRYVLRYAEALLIFAEADNMHKGQPSDSAYLALNMVRRRAAGSDPNVPDANLDLSGLSKEEFHDAVLDELAWEFAAEWHRWFDLVRNQMVSKATAKRDANELGLDGVRIGDSEPNFVKFYYAPIPENDMALRPDWQQNDCCR